MKFQLWKAFGVSLTFWWKNDYGTEAIINVQDTTHANSCLLKNFLFTPVVAFYSFHPLN